MAIQSTDLGPLVERIRGYLNTFSERNVLGVVFVVLNFGDPS